MPREDLAQTHDGVVYTFSYMQTSKALRIATDVARRALPAIGAMFKGASMDDQTDKLNLEALTSVLATKMDPEEVTTLIAQLCSVVVANGVGVLEGGAFEEHFKGRPGLALTIAAKSFEVNCGDFFVSAVSLATSAKAAATTLAPQR